jgi:hypothetical protein
MGHNFVANSIAVHLLDDMVPSGTLMLACAPTQLRAKHLHLEVIAAIEGAERQRITKDEITINGKLVKFLGIDSLKTRGYNPDYLFLDSSDEYTEEQHAAIAPLRIHSIILESHGTRMSKEDQDVE